MIPHILVLIVAIFCGSIAQAKPPAEWPFKEWTVAAAQAAKENKPLFVLFGFEDCRWCQHLYREALSDTKLREKYQESVVLTYVDIKSHQRDEKFILPGEMPITRAELIKRFHVYSTPSWVFLSPSGAILYSDQGGNSTTREMFRDLEIALSRK